MNSVYVSEINRKSVMGERVQKIINNFVKNSRYPHADVSKRVSKFDFLLPKQ